MTPVLVVRVKNTNIVMDSSINNPSQPRAVIQVAIGILVNSKGQLLIAKRPDHWLGGGFWEFPGGKVEKNEDTTGALKRELLEEIGIIVNHCTPLISLTYEYPERTVVLHAWRVLSYSGTPEGLEGQEIAWCDPFALNQINMLPANRAIVIATQLPSVYLITPECHDQNDFMKTLERSLLQNQIKLMQLRSKSLSSNAYISLAKHVAELCKELKVQLLLNHEDLQIINKVDADGIHLQSHQIYQLDKRLIDRNKWWAASCHTLQDIKKAEEINVDFIVISPVNKTYSVGASLGWDGFYNLASKANVPAYALGGIGIDDLSLSQKWGAQGIAAIKSLWMCQNSEGAVC